MHPIEISESDGVRRLHFGSGWVQGAMRIARPYALALEYTQVMMACLLMRETGALFRRWPRTALLVGLGAGSVAKFLHRHVPDCRITVVEINPQIEFIARQYFKLPDESPRFNVQIGCGADYLARCKRRFDLILVDGFSPDGQPGALATPAFYQDCRARLTSPGIFCVNVLRETGWREQISAIDNAFSQQTAVFPPCASGNTLVFGRGEENIRIDIVTLEARAAALKKHSQLKLAPTLKTLPAGGLDF
jgi:spermidine synthase